MSIKHRLKRLEIARTPDFAKLTDEELRAIIIDELGAERAQQVFFFIENASDEQQSAIEAGQPCPEWDALVTSLDNPQPPQHWRSE